VKRGLLVLVVLTLLALGAEMASGDNLQTLPNPSATTSASSGATGGLSNDRVKQALATVEVTGRGTTGVAIVLDGDGRLVTSLAAVGANDLADVRYADNHVVHTRAAHKDTVLDLALLVPLSGRYTTGLVPSDLDPTTTELRTVTLSPRPTIVAAKLKGRVDAHARDGTNLTGATELDTRTPIGAPVLDPAGKVVGVIAHACKNTDAAGCVDVSVVVPILSARIFLSKTPSNAVSPSPWLGINGTPDVVGGIRGVRVQAVAPHSPAERGGIHAQTDLIVVADGNPLDTPEHLAELVSKHAVGDTVKLSVFAAGRYREVDVVLQAAP
jgi:S1-C subfamily serine protease